MVTLILYMESILHEKILALEPSHTNSQAHLLVNVFASDLNQGCYLYSNNNNKNIPIIHHWIYLDFTTKHFYLCLQWNWTWLGTCSHFIKSLHLACWWPRNLRYMVLNLSEIIWSMIYQNRSCTNMQKADSEQRISRFSISDASEIETQLL